jgi:hypothetical protein
MENLVQRSIEKPDQARRDFLKAAGKLAATAPAVSLLVSVPSTAQIDDTSAYGPDCQLFDGVQGPCADLQPPV